MSKLNNVECASTVIYSRQNDAFLYYTCTHRLEPYTKEKNQWKRRRIGLGDWNTLYNFFLFLLFECCEIFFFFLLFDTDMAEFWGALLYPRDYFLLILERRMVGEQRQRWRRRLGDAHEPTGDAGDNFGRKEA
jgi:hypothetical protein